MAELTAGLIDLDAYSITNVGLIAGFKQSVLPKVIPSLKYPDDFPQDVLEDYINVRSKKIFSSHLTKLRTPYTVGQDGVIDSVKKK